MDKGVVERFAAGNGGGDADKKRMGKTTFLKGLEHCCHVGRDVW